jgi:hypothetical protein
MLHAKYILVATGILGEQCSFDDRRLENIEQFEGKFTLAGKHQGCESIIGNTNTSGKVVTIRSVAEPSANRCVQAMRA